MAEDFGKKIGQFGQDIWKKTTDAVGTISKSAEISNKTRELKVVYTDIGEQFFIKHPDQVLREFPKLAVRAKALEAEIDELNTSILEQRGSKKCVKCGMQIVVQAAFCPMCGTAQPKLEQGSAADPEIVDHWICPSCKEQMGIDDIFCSSCGTKRP